MEKPVITNFQTLGTLLIQKYERYLPTAFDESLSLVQKVNKVIIHLNQIGELTNDVTDQWNKVMEWILEDGLTEAVSDGVEIKIQEMIDNGAFDEIVNETIFSELNNRINGISYFISDYPLLTGETHDGLRINRAISDINSKGGGKLLFENGKTYTTQVKIDLLGNVDLDLNGSTIKAVVTPLTSLIDTSSATRIYHPTIENGTLDCGGLAQIGIYLRNFAEAVISKITVENPSLIHIQLGDPTVNPASYGARLLTVIGDRQRPTPTPVGSIGLYLAKATDNYFENCSFISAETGIKTVSGSSGNVFLNVHPWARLPESTMNIGFDIGSGDNLFTNCVADTILEWAFINRANGWRNTYIGTKVINLGGGNNMSTNSRGFQIEDGVQNLTFIGTIFNGYSAATSIKEDFHFNNTSVNYADTNKIRIIGSSGTYTDKQTILNSVQQSTPDSTTDMDEVYLRNGNRTYLLKIDANNNNYTLMDYDPLTNNWRNNVYSYERANQIFNMGSTIFKTGKQSVLPSAGATYRGATIRTEDDTNGDNIFDCIRMGTSGHAFLPRAYVNANGSSLRPTGVKIGTQYFDTTLGKPIWLKSVGVWVDANGTTV